MFMHLLRRARPLLLLTPCVMLAAPSYAQGVPGAPTGTGGIATGQRHGGAATAPRVAEPAALPGAQPRRGPAPAANTVGTLGPTDALFDAVNRGDVAAARDAVSRGADMNQQNVLGLTPLELSVDLGHNDIAFLLLSLRGAETAGKAGSGASKAAAMPARPVSPPRPAAAAAVTPVKAPAAPRPGASDGGAPIPNAGFLGFNNGR